MTALTVQQLVVSVTPEVRESYMSVREQMVASQKTKKKKKRKKKDIRDQLPGGGEARYQQSYSFWLVCCSDSLEVVFHRPPPGCKLHNAVQALKSPPELVHSQAGLGLTC